MRRPNSPGPQQRFYFMDPTNQRTCSYYKAPRFFLWCLGPTFVLSLFGWGVFAFDVSLLPQNLADKPLLAVIFVFLFNVPMLLASISLIRTTIEDPGSVPNNFEEDVILRERNPKGEMRYCKVCQRLKPDRAHHCSTLGQCVLKMDHFCPWVGNTVGWRNYKFFMLFLIYTTITCLTGSLLSLRYTILYMSQTSVTPSEINQIIFTFVAGMFGLVLVAFTGQHLWMVFNNLTTIESFDRTRVKSNAYDVGKSRNWKQVFGADPLLWFVPVLNPVGDGIQWSINIDESSLPLAGEVV